MIVLLGLIILVAAVIAGLAGVLGNSGSGHALSHGFAVLGYHVTGSTGTLFLYGIVAGVAGLLGLSLLLAGARRASRRGRAARRGLRQSRRETAAASEARDDLADQRKISRAYTASSPGHGTPRGSHQPATSGSRWNWLHLPGLRPAPRQAAGMHPQPRNGQPGPQTPAGASAPADDSPERVSQP
jgi:hypothetical protein